MKFIIILIITCVQMIQIDVAQPTSGNNTTSVHNTTNNPSDNYTSPPTSGYITTTSEYNTPDSVIVVENSALSNDPTLQTDTKDSGFVEIFIFIKRNNVSGTNETSLPNSENNTSEHEDQGDEYTIVTFDVGPILLPNSENNTPEYKDHEDEYTILSNDVSPISLPNSENNTPEHEDHEDEYTILSNDINPTSLPDSENNTPEYEDHEDEYTILSNGDNSPPAYTYITTTSEHDTSDPPIIDENTALSNDPTLQRDKENLKPIEIFYFITKNSNVTDDNYTSPPTTNYNIKKSKHFVTEPRLIRQHYPTIFVQ